MGLYHRHRNISMSMDYIDLRSCSIDRSTLLSIRGGPFDMWGGGGGGGLAMVFLCD